MELKYWNVILGCWETVRTDEVFIDGKNVKDLKRQVENCEKCKDINPDCY